MCVCVHGACGFACVCLSGMCVHVCVSVCTPPRRPQAHPFCAVISADGVATGGVLLSRHLYRLPGAQQQRKCCNRSKPPNTCNTRKEKRCHLSRAEATSATHLGRIWVTWQPISTAVPSRAAPSPAALARPLLALSRRKSPCVAGVPWVTTP